MVKPGVDCKKMSTTDKQYLERFRNYTTEVRMFLSSKKKPEKERSECRAFLRILAIPFEDSEIIAPVNEPVDVIFREARFQVTDIVESNHRRGDFWKEKQRKHQTATSIYEAIETDPPPMPVSVDLNALIPEVISELTKKAKKYGVTCKRAVAQINVLPTF
jgi:hypothetical protein